MEELTTCKPAKLYFEQYTPDNCNHSVPPIVFVHGFCSLHTTWNSVWKRISDNTQRKAYSLDIRNHGQSEWNKTFSLSEAVADLENFLIENGIKKCIFISHSLGGKITLNLALTKPEFVDMLVVEEMPLRNGNEEENDMVKTMFSYLNKMPLLPKSLTESEIRKFFSKVVGEKFPIYSNLAFFVPFRRAPDGGFTCNFNVPTLEQSLEDLSLYCIDFQKCQKFHGRVLFIYGETCRDKVEEDELIPKYLPNAEFCLLNHPGHILHVECLNDFVERVVKFINN